MVSGSTRKVTILALVFFTFLFMPSTLHTASAGPPKPFFVYEPAMTSPLSTSPPSLPMPSPSIGYAPNPAPTSGTLKVLIIAAQFSDIPHSLSIDTVKSEWTTQVAKFYQEDSLGTVSLSVTISGWYTLPYNEAHYGRDCNGIDSADCSGSDSSWNIAQDASILARNNVTFANYDYYVFIHSGNGQESSGVSNDVWSVTYLGGVWVNPCLDVQQNCYQKTLTRFNVDPELEAGGAVPIGVYCHEFGHNLGLPDLYNTNTGKTILGPWSLMDKGLWNGNPPGSSPSHMDAWSKIQLGFLSGSMIATANAGSTTTYSIDPTEVASSNVHAVMVPLGTGTSPAQYYIIEVRAPIGFDAAQPSFGVLLLYVDETKSVGKIQIVNSHPSVADLSLAPWGVSQTFTDTANSWSMTVTGHTGNSYQVTVNRGGSPPPPPIQQNQTYIQLAIASISAEPPVITLPNTTVTVTVQVSNIGTQAATNVPIEVTLDSQPYTNLQVSVNAGATTPATFTWISKTGSHTFNITLDPNHTINETSRANNVATFTLNVGPTLTINVPLNITSNGNLWVTINGVKYNITSNQFQTSVPNGTITVQIQPAVNSSQGVRQSFTGWADGNTSNPRQITVTSGTALQALYTTQYLLAVNSNGGTTTASGWYKPNSTVTVTAANPSNVTANTSRYLFSSWSGDLSSTSTALNVTLNKPLSLQANWIKQYYVTIISPTGSPTGQGWYNAGTVVTVAVQSAVQYPNGTRMIFNGWNSTALGNNPTQQITVNSPTRLLAAWKTEYLLTLNSQYGPTLGGGWYDAGASAHASVPAAIDYTNSTRRSFAGWTGDLSTLSNNATIFMDAPKTLNAQWSTQYLVTFGVSGLPNATMVKLTVNNITYTLPATSTYQTWLQKGTTINPTLNQTIANGIMSYKFTGWRNSTGGTAQNPLTVNAPSTYIASYAPQLSIPAIPGFPVEGILLGLLFGAMLLTLKRKTKPRAQ